MQKINNSIGDCTTNIANMASEVFVMFLFFFAFPLRLCAFAVKNQIVMN